jgi:hypothetical protein
MADSKVSALTATTTLADADEFYVVDGGVSKRATVETLKDQLVEARVQTDPLDTTVGALLPVGAFGLGAGATEVYADLDDISEPGFYAAPATTLNLPVGSANYNVITSQRNANNQAQVAFGEVADSMWIRTKTGTVWQPWTEVYTQSSVLGTVSESSGVPTGAIIERGTNANGEYVRYADGTLICTLAATAGSIAIATAFMGGFKTVNQQWTYPSEFATSPVVNGTPSAQSCFSVSLTSIAPTTCAWAGTAVTSQSAADRSVSLIAIGRWF